MTENAINGENDGDDEVVEATCTPPDDRTDEVEEALTLPGDDSE